jgi:hypothetical protein
MTQSVQVKEMETYIKRLGELLNVVYERMTGLEAKINSLESEVAKLKGDVEVSKSNIDGLRGQSVPRQDFDELVSSLTSSLKALVPESTKEPTPTQQSQSTT